MTEQTQSQRPRPVAPLEEVDGHDGRPAFVLTTTELKLLGIAGVSLSDALQLFTIRLCSPYLGRVLLGW